MGSFGCAAAAECAQPSAALPALRRAFAAADLLHAASIDFQTRIGTGRVAVGVHPLRHQLPLWGGADGHEIQISTSVNRCSPTRRTAASARRWRSAYEHFRSALR